MDLITREVFMPLLCADTTSSDHSDKLMDVMHRIITQIAVAQSQIEDSVTLPLPALGVYSSIIVYSLFRNVPPVAQCIKPNNYKRITNLEV